MTSPTPDQLPDPAGRDPSSPEMAEPAIDAAEPARRGLLGRIGHGAIGWAPTILLAVLVYAALTTFAVQTVEVQQTSMYPTLKPGDRLIVEKLDRNFRYGDIVIFAPPASVSALNGVDFIKRVIGLPGDVIDVHDGAVWRNGVKVSEPYLQPGVVTTPLNGTQAQTWTLQPGQMFVMGDNRPGSSDSRAFGPVEESSVVGKVILRYWPVAKFGMP